MADPRPGRRVADALRARSSGAVGRPGPPGRGAADRARTGWALLLGLLAGGALGTILALVSILAPGLLPPVG